MAKYSYKCKKQIVKEYVKGNGSDYVLAKKYGVPSAGQVRIWVAAYKKWGDDGLKRARQRTVFSFQKKLSVVKSYLPSELSYQKLVFQSGIGNPSTITRWVSKFRVDELSPVQYRLRYTAV